MGDKDLHEKFGVNEEELEKRAAEYESDDWSRMQFGEVTQGRPRICDEQLDTITLKVPHSRIVAMGRVIEDMGISRSEFVRRAIDNELASQAL